MRYLILILAFLFSGIATFVYTNYKTNPSNNNNYVPAYNIESGKEIALIYIGSPHCGFSNSEEMLKLLKISKVKIKNIAIANNYQASVLGIAIAWSVKEGMEHLNKMGPFDEVMIGRNWFNTGARKIYL